MCMFFFESQVVAHGVKTGFVNFPYTPSSGW